MAGFALRRLTARSAYLSAACLALAAGSVFVPSARAQSVAPEATPAKAPPAKAEGEPQTPVELLKDFIHFVRIDRADVAAGVGRQLLDLKLTPTQFVDVVEQSSEVDRFETTIPRAMRQGKELEEIAAQMRLAFNTGKLQRARSPEQITKSIAGLTGGLRERLISRERLVAASEYAMPQLLEAYLDRNNPARQEQVRSLLVDQGRVSIMPLTTALPKLDASQQEQVVNVLGLIKYKTAIPFIADLQANTQSADVRTACLRAMENLEAQGISGDVAGLYAQLAEGFYSERADLTSFATEDNQLLWDFNPGVGLTMQAIRTPVYHEAMAMRLLERSLTIRSDNPQALALWIASNFRREIQTPSGYSNPAYSSSRREAMYYAVASGSQIEQAVLARALDATDTNLARRAISALEKSAGGASLWSAADGAAGRRPLPEALTYPNRRVQYEAALALAAAQPRTAFSGSDRVVPTLASAIRGSAVKTAIVLTAENETYTVLRGMLEKQGFTVLPFGRSVADMATPLSETAAVDLVVLNSQRGEVIPTLIDDVRATAKLSAAPVLALTSPEAYPDLQRRYERNNSIAVRPSATGETQIAKAIELVVTNASGGPITEQEAKNYQGRALTALRDLAVSQSPVFNVGDATLPLIAAINEAKGEERLGIAEILCRVPQERAQTALMESALTSKAGERVALLGKVADSAKRFGNLLPSRQVNELVELASSGVDTEATAAAALMGALNLPNDKLIPFILKQGEKLADKK